MMKISQKIGLSALLLLSCIQMLHAKELEPQGQFLHQVLETSEKKSVRTGYLSRVRLKKKSALVELKLDQEVNIKQGFAPASDKKGDRLFYDLYPVKSKKHQYNFDVNNENVKSIRLAQNSAEKIRIVFDLKNPAFRPVIDLNEKNHNLTFDFTKPDTEIKEAKEQILSELLKEKIETIKITDDTKKQVIKEAQDEVENQLITEKMVNEMINISKKRTNKITSPQEETKVASKELNQKEELTKEADKKSDSLVSTIASYSHLKRIVIDAGHGGKDTGAIGRKGLKEKDVTLAVAKMIKKKLKARLPKLDVILTRDTDVFLELKERTDIANEAKSDLFVSVHVNANPNRKIRGIETYYLNMSHDRYAKRLANRENKHNPKGEQLTDIDFILADLAMKSNVDDSIQLGKYVQESLVKNLRKDYTGIKDHGLRHALFYVLLTSRMPAILVETSFVSNKTDEKRMRTKAYKEHLADGIVRGIVRYAETQKQILNRKTASK